MNNFDQWLKTQLKTRGWSQIELAKRSGLARGAISNFVAGRRIPNPESCAKIAEALNLPPETVLSAAGSLEEKRMVSLTVNRIVEIVTRMNEDERKYLLDFAQWTYQRNRE